MMFELDESEKKSIDESKKIFDAIENAIDKDLEKAKNVEEREYILRVYYMGLAASLLSVIESHPKYLRSEIVDKLTGLFKQWVGT